MLEAILFSVVMASAETDIRKCSGMEDSVKRLSCYDDLGKGLQSQADAELKKTISAASNNWRVDARRSPVDDSPSIVLSATAKSTVPGRYGRTSRPMLMLRCTEQRTVFYIHFDQNFMADTGSYGDVTLRTDKDKAREVSMKGSTDHTALGLWNGSTSIPLIKSLFGKNTLLVRATPYSESQITFEFDISGLEEAIKPLREACSW